MPSVELIEKIIKENPQISPYDVGVIVCKDGLTNFPTVRQRVNRRITRLVKYGDIVRVRKGIYCHVDSIPQLLEDGVIFEDNINV